MTLNGLIRLIEQIQRCEASCADLPIEVEIKMQCGNETFEIKNIKIVKNYNHEQVIVEEHIDKVIIEC